MKARVRWISSVPSLCYDGTHGRVIEVVRKVDSKGREWREWSTWDGDGQATAYNIQIEAPEEPQAERTRKVVRKSK